MAQAALILGIFSSLLRASAGESTPPQISRYIAIDNVCAWPNLTLLRGRSMAAVIHNRPNRGRMEGDLDCWVRQTGEF